MITGSVKAVFRSFLLLPLMLLPPMASAGESVGLVTTLERVATELDARVGFAAYDMESGQRWEFRANERFAMTSTFKTLACAALLHRVDTGTERLDRKVHISEADLVTHSPVTGTLAGRRAMTLSELCEATLTRSDNTAANLILRALGGPSEITAFARSLGDKVTRLDRWETGLNEAVPDDRRDTTTPKAMVGNLRKLLLGDALSPESRDQLRDWLEGNRVADGLFRAVVPDDWVVADRTGAGGYGSRSITALIWPPERQPVIVALYITQTEASFPERDEAIAVIGEAIVTEIRRSR